MSDLQISPEIAIPESELEYAASRSAGPGGQNVNKVNSRVTVKFDVQASVALNDLQKERIARRLATRINREGVLQVSSQRFRTQQANRDAATARLAELLADALAEERPRKKTRVPRRARETRLEAKKHRSTIKRERRTLE